MFLTHQANDMLFYNDLQISLTESDNYSTVSASCYNDELPTGANYQYILTIAPFW